MANTAELLTLMGEFPNAFLDPEPVKVTSHQITSTTQTDDTQKLLNLMQDFPEAFADPEIKIEQPSETQSLPESQPKTTAPEGSLSAIAPPTGYRFALQREFSTFTWGTIAVSLNYDSEGLHSIWVIVGKSGTEIQSFCEGICRLANVLLTQKVPVNAIARELRGIRGADSEGLGPHRILGLVDLIGKALQEAPTSFMPEASPTTTPTTPKTIDTSHLGNTSPAQANLSDNLPSVVTEATSSAWADLSDNNHRMSVCPECGSELQAANGCSGGACLVCGYSSCS